MLTAGEDFRTGQDRRHRRPELVREDTHEGLSHPSCLAGCRDVPDEKDRAARRRVGRADDRESAQLEPSPWTTSEHDLDGSLPFDGAQPRRTFVGVVEERQELGVGPDPRVCEDVVCGGIRRAHCRHVADDDRVADRRQCRLELGRSCPCLLHEALQLGLRFDTLGRIADDRQQLRLAVITIESLDQHVDGTEFPTSSPQDRRDGGRSRRRRSTIGSGLLHRSEVEQRDESSARPSAPRAPTALPRAPIRVHDAS
jgi:hypothetical protein